MIITAGTKIPSPLSRVPITALILAMLTIVFVVMSSVGFRMEWWGYGSSVKILRVAAFVGMAAAVLSIIGIYMAWPGRSRRGLVISILALLIVGPTLVLPLYWGYSKSKLPPIQDISTDLENPPEFWDAPTSRLYPGPKVARQQRTAYPDIQPVIFSSPMEQVSSGPHPGENARLEPGCGRTRRREDRGNGYHLLVWIQRRRDNPLD